MTKKIIIVGGGYAGTRMAHALDSVADVTLIEPREAFFHSVAAIRAVVQPDLLERLIVPYDRLLRNGRIIRARATQIGEGAVVLDDGRRVEGDIVIATTGSGYAQPFKPHADSISEYRKRQAEAHAAVLEAQTVVIVGAGPVGVELAAEIKAAHPRRNVTILAASDAVVPGISPKLSRALSSQIAAMGIELRLGVPVDGLQSTDAPFAGTLQAGGRSYAADIVFPAFGARPVLPPLQGETASRAGRLVVDPWMRPNGYRHVFALGDAADNGDPMTIVAVRRQVPWLTRTIKSMIAGRPIDALPPYRKAMRPLLLVPLGHDGGSSVMPVGRQGWVVGPWLTQRIKGRDLFLTDTRKELGYA